MLLTGPFPQVAMVDDAAQEVGRRALQSLTKLAGRFEFSTEQLQAVLKILGCGAPASRAEAHRVLREVRFATYRCLEASVHALLLYLERFPEETPAIVKTMGSIGSNHAVFAECLIDDMLYRTDVEAPVQPEPRLDDAFYVCKMALFLSAVPKNRNLLALLPPWAQVHYNVLKQLHPEVLPTFCLRDVGGGTFELLEGEDSSSVMLRELGVPLRHAAREEGLAVVQVVVKRVDDLKRAAGGSPERLRDLNQCQSDLAVLGRSAGDLSGWLTFLEVYVACVAMVICMRHNGAGGSSKSLPWMGSLRSRFPWIDRGDRNIVMQLMELVVFLRHSFEGHAPGHLDCLEDLWAAAAAFRLPVSSDPPAGGKLVWAMCLEPLRMTEAMIVRPATSSEEPLFYTAGFPLTLDIEARLVHLTHDLDRLALRAECSGFPTALLRLLDSAAAPDPDGGGDTAARLNCQVRLSLPDAARSVLRLQFVALVPGGEAPLGPAHPLHVAGQAAADPTHG